jgi:glycosyltransferase involved in cell wall biosynthesis
MKNNPLVSVIIPTYNSSKYIKETLESILDQTYSNLEIVITDDASKDDTLDIVRGYEDSRIKILTNKKNLGISGNMNKGILSSKGKYIAIMDADDWSYPYRIEKQVKMMEENPNVVLCSGYMDMCDENLKFKHTRTYPTTNEEIRKVLLRYDPIAHPASMWRKETLLKTNLYPLYVNNTCHDYSLIFEISQYGEFQNIPESLIKYRIRKDSVTGKKVRQTQLFSTYFQIKAIVEYGFKPTFGDKVFIFLRTISAYVLPVQIQRAIANNFNYKKKK